MSAGAVRFVGGPYDGIERVLPDTTVEHVVIERSAERFGGPVTTTKHTYVPLAGGFYYQHDRAEIQSVGEERPR